MLFEHTIRGPIQAGKTTLALGALERLHAAGVCVAYVLPTHEWARDASRRTNVPCVPWIDAVNSPNENWRAVAVDDLEHCPTAGLDVLRRTLSAALGPTQLILVETSEPPNVKVEPPLPANRI